MAFDLFTYLQEARLVGVIAVFFLIFAIVYGILLKTKIFKDNKLNGSIAIIIGLIASNIDFSSGCLSEILKFFVISITIILIAYLIVGLFLDPKNKKIKYMFLGSIIIGAIIFFSTSDICRLRLSLQLGGVLPWIISFIILAGIIYNVIKEPKKKEKDGEEEEEEEKKEKDGEEEEEDEDVSH